MLDINLDRSSRHTLSRQLYEELRRLIVTGELPPKAPLPASRSFSTELELSRATVVAAFARLKQEGYIEALDGSGTFVSTSLPAQPIKPAQEGDSPMQLQIRRARLASYAKKVMNYPGIDYRWNEPEICFYGWRGALNAAPVTQLTQAFSRAARKFEPALLDYAREPMGYKPLREAIAKWLRKTRNIKCSASQILIVCGLRQAIDLIARVHIDRGDLVAMEDPCYPALRDIFELEGATIFPTRVDVNGLKVDDLKQASDESFRLLYVSPSHQNPTGVALTLNRRMELLSWARRNGVLIVEDEHDSEFQFGVGAIPALKGLDEQDQVVFLGSFYKTLFPSLGVAYLVLPEALVEPYYRTRDFIGEHVPLLLQAMLADFMQRGYMLRHVRKMQALYAKRRECLIGTLEKYFAQRATIFGDEAGMHILVRFQTKLSDAEIVRRAQEAGVGVLSSAPYYAKQPPQPAEIIMGFADLSEAKIEEGVRRLATII